MARVHKTRVEFSPAVTRWLARLRDCNLIGASASRVAAVVSANMLKRRVANLMTIARKFVEFPSVKNFFQLKPEECHNAVLMF